jgi:hypothetical protein
MAWTPNVKGGKGGVPSRLWHGTSRKHLDSILRDGLQPQRLSASRSPFYRPGPEPPYGVYLTGTFWVAQFRAGQYHNNGVILEVKVKGLDLVKANAYSYVSLVGIEPDRVTVLD